MSIRGEPKSNAETPATVLSEAANTDTALAEGNSFSVASPDSPLERTVLVSVRLHLTTYVCRRQRGRGPRRRRPSVRSSSRSALRRSMGRRRAWGSEVDRVAFYGCQTRERHVPDHPGRQDYGRRCALAPFSHGASLVLTPPVRSQTTQHFRQPGEAFSTILLPNSESTAEKKLQADDVSLAYEFSKKFPGYTAECAWRSAALPATSRAHPPLCVRSNLAEKGIREVSQRRFVLVSADHPIVSAVRLQCLSNTSIARHAKRSPLLRRSRRTPTSSRWERFRCAGHRVPFMPAAPHLTPPSLPQMMPEGLVKISQTLYESILPLVRTQVE